ncbi:MAG: hypothetical protein CMJ19_06745 [Phycisphaeraceae bacterium]|nr:hypothetical protein [Phycisphaeraceae bacterium]
MILLVIFLKPRIVSQIPMSNPDAVLFEIKAPVIDTFTRMPKQITNRRQEDDRQIHKQQASAKWCSQKPMLGCECVGF